MILYLDYSKIYILIAILLSIILLAFISIIYLLMSRKSFYKKVVIDYKIQLSEIKERTSNALSEFESEYENTLKQAASNTNTELKENIKETLYLRDEIQKLNSLISKISNDLKENYFFLNDEIKKRDAIIERKTKQNKRLK